MGHLAVRSCIPHKAEARCVKTYLTYGSMPTQGGETPTAVHGDQLKFITNGLYITTHVFYLLSFFGNTQLYKVPKDQF